ncbi:Ctr-domain-containing protein [Suhomyces tanzawaensis NRRL Y-17324]|uniref:Copper transport protein n=1 Tax=Suhomyces tanzawaensis NRRL Y-17324 TaxID=984487 RepID=A0A1E4SQN5_9ASCO|nr:Ctr-domain-containing protein [Suhomyces tanzawaensis NRRL Y-17324]ODV81811.1 Ctr-domain-containing protein [Suhomyces tanzawaensis NRRL Y-17324]
MGSMDMGSMAMATASSTMDMGAHHTSGMSMATSTGMEGMHMGGMDGMDGMHMFFTTEFKNYPVLFSSLTASTKAQAFGIFVLFFFLAFVARGFEFLRMYLEQLVWKNPVYVECHPGDEANVISPKETANCCGGDDSDDSIKKPNSAVFRADSFEHDKRDATNNLLSMASRVYRDIIRLVLCILPDLFGYSLMLVAMTYTLVYFFAVVIGSGVGRFFFERLSDKLNIKASTSFGRHC